MLARSSTLLSRSSRTILSTFSRSVCSLSFTSSPFSAPRVVPVHSSTVYSHQFVRHFASEFTKIPSLGDSITEGTIVAWQKNVGDYVAIDEVLLVLETEKVSVDIRAAKGGVLTKQLFKAGDVVKVGQDVAETDTAAAAAPAAGAKPAAAPAATAPAAAAAAKAPAAAAAAPAPAAKSAAAPAKPAVNTPAPAPGSRNERRVPMSRMRQTIATRLKHAQNTAACLTTFNEVDMTNLQDLRNKYKDDFLESHGIKLGFMSAFVKASTAALKKYPEVNAYIEEKEIVYHDYVDISVAVSTPTGLVVPVLRNTENMSFADVESAINALGQKARKGQIAMEDMVGGTFTISNGGVYGSLFGTPILNPPQSAILGMHGIFKRPIVVNDKIEIRPMMYIALTYDHRIIDGSTAVTFLKTIKNIIEDPQRLLLSV